MTSAEAIAGPAAAGTRQRVRTWTMVALAMFVLNLVAYAGFMTVGGVWFTISDAAGLALAVSMVSVVTGMDRLLRPVSASASRVMKVVGITGMAIVMVGSIVLLTSDVSHEFVPAQGGLGMQFAGFGLEGVWFLMLGRLSTRTGLYTRHLGIICYLIGAGFVVGSLGAPLGPDSLPVTVGMVGSFVGFILWAVLSRRQLAG